MKPEELPTKRTLSETDKAKIKNYLGPIKNYFTLLENYNNLKKANELLRN